jgi:hypothetical protein
VRIIVAIASVDRQTAPEHRTSDANDLARFREFLDSNPFQRTNDFLRFRRQRTVLVPKFGQQFVLDHVPALHQQFASGSMLIAGDMILSSINRIMLEMAACTFPFSPCAAKKVGLQ